MKLLTRRSAIGAGIAVAATAVVARVAEPGITSLPDLRQAGDVDDEPAFRRAAALGRPIHAPAGRGSGPRGEYVIGSSDRDNLPSGLTLYGDGREQTVIRIAVDHPFLLHCDSKSADPAHNITGLTFRDLTFASDVEKRGFSEFEYLVMLNGATDVTFDRVGFHGFRGDGLHLGSSTVSKVERHNRDIVIRDCIFDGINANNRNAISILDCTNLTIERCRFLNCTRTGDGTTNAGDPFNVRTGLGMPGPIDIEPNFDAFAIVRDVVIRDNRFRGGGGFAVAVHALPNDVVTVPQMNIRVTGNVIEDRVGGIDVTGYGGNDAMKPAAPGYSMNFADNQVTRCTTPFRISGVRGLTMTGNRFVDCTDRAELNNNAAVADVAIRGNRFERIGSDTAPFGLWLRDGDRVTIENNDFVDCGGPTTRTGSAIALVAGTPRQLTITNNRFTSPLRRMDKPLLVFRDAKPDRRAITLRGNVSALPGGSLAGALGL